MTRKERPMRLKSFLFLILLFNTIPVSAHRQKIVESNGVELWTETYGNPQGEPLLLIAGGAAQAIMWPHDFCKSLAKKGFYVIRYDHRDVGLSTAIDYQKKPYTLMDLTKDAVGILDHYHIPKAHIVGLSMGGQIGQFLGAYYPGRLLTLTLISTSTTFDPLLKACDGKKSTSKLRPPEKAYLKWASDYFKNMPTYSEDKKRKEFMNGWCACNGQNVPFDQTYYLQFMKQHFARSKHPENVVNHVSAMKASYDDHAKAVPLIKAATLIIHGRKDPLFPIDHGENLHHSILGSQMIVKEGMGHLIPSSDFADIVEAIANHGKTERE